MKTVSFKSELLAVHFRDSRRAEGVRATVIDAGDGNYLVHYWE